MKEDMRKLTFTMIGAIGTVGMADLGLFGYFMLMLIGGFSGAYLAKITSKK